MPKFLFSDRLIAQVKDIQLSTMDFTCQIERNSTESEDDWNDENPEDYQSLPDRVACSFKPASEEMDRKTGQYVEVPAKVKMPLGTDVRLNDRLIDIRDRNDIAVEPSRFEIKSITPRIGNLKLVLQAIG